jgi:ubiquinone/menaquinone biosynthesis C-methylase UbiE
VRPEAQEEEAIRVHSEQAGLFRGRYAALEGDPYSSCFAYTRRRLQVHLDILLPHPAENARLLDVGCGTGNHLRWARERGFDVAGTDGSEAMLTEARRLNPAADLRLAPADRVPFPDASFDAGLCIEVFRYLPDVRPCIREMARILRPGGVCLATASPLLNLNLFPIVNRLAVRVPMGGVVRLKQFFHTSFGLESRFREAGFREVAVHGVYLGPINWVERIAPSVLPRFLRGFEKLDGALADLPLMRDLSAMLLVHAIR